MAVFKRGNASRYILLALFSIIFLVPFIYAVYTSLLKHQYVDTFAPLSGFSLVNYQYVFSQKIGTWYLNSIIVTVTILIGNIIVNTMAAYALAKIKFPGRSLVFFIIIAMMMVPYQTIIIPLYTMLVKLDWINTYRCLTIPFLFQGFLVFLMRQFFFTIPNDLEEAAKLDGLSKAGTFFRIILPISKTALASQIIFSFTGTWNFFTWGATFINDDSMYILPVGLNTLKNRNFTIPGYTMAGVVLMTLPIAAIFIAFQKYFIQGIASTGIKG
jgi:multiple sugar transport system permease protein